ncbi:hypothetical protein ACJX0J_017224, partial [Zea mays]
YLLRAYSLLNFSHTLALYILVPRRINNIISLVFHIHIYVGTIYMLKGEIICVLINRDQSSFLKDE